MDAQCKHLNSSSWKNEKLNSWFIIISYPMWSASTKQKANNQRHKQLQSTQIPLHENHATNPRKQKCIQVKFQLLALHLFSLRANHLNNSICSHFNSTAISDHQPLTSDGHPNRAARKSLFICKSATWHQTTVRASLPLFVSLNPSLSRSRSVVLSLAHLCQSVFPF